MPRTVNGTGQSETEPTSRAVPTPPDEAHNERIIAKLKKELRAFIARAPIKTEEDVQKVVRAANRALIEIQGELIFVPRKAKEEEEEKTAGRRPSRTRVCMS